MILDTRMVVHMSRSSYSAEEIAAIEEYSSEFMDAARYGELDDLKLMWNHERLRQLIDFKSLVEDETQTSPLMLACANGHLDCVEFLVETVQTDINHQNVNGNCALHWSALNGHSVCVEYLISKGANVLLENSFQRTPFDEAMTRDKKECCEILVEEEVRLAKNDEDSENS
jgi:ankyrin repeat protein